MSPSPPRLRGPWAAFAASFRWAFTGLVEGAQRDRNLRVHLAAGVAVGGLAALGPLSPAERALLLLCVALVVALEVLNTALEHAVDLARPGPDEGARRAKDSAAGAVLAGAAGAVLAAGAILGPRAEELWAALGASPAAVAGTAMAALAAGVLPWRAGASRARDWALVLAGLAGFVALAAEARAQAGTAGAGLCLAVAFAAAGRARRS